jgi:hypothetical protein
MSRRFAKFMSPGLRSRSLGAHGGALFAIAVSALAVAPRALAQEHGQEVASQAAIQSEGTRMLARAFRARPADVFVKFAHGSTMKGADRARRAAQDLGRVLAAQAAAGGEEERGEIGALLERGVRGAFARGLTMAQTVDVLTMVDPIGELIDEEVRAALWREIARRPSGLRSRPSNEVPAKSGRGGSEGAIDA